MKRYLVVVALSVGLLGQVAVAGTRLASVYVESISALQTQLLQAAQVFEAPELGSAPMIMSMMIPGFAQIDKNAPVGIHVYAGGEDKVGVVISLTPSVAPEVFLGGLLAMQGATLPDAVDGRYVTPKGVAQMQGEQLLIGRKVQDLDLALQTGIPAVLPVVPGLIRLDVAPATLVEILGELEALALETMPADAEQREMLQKGMGFYRRGLAQVASFQQGIGITEQGLVCRSRMLPQPGRALEAIVQSLQPVDATWVAQLEEDRLFGAVAGAYSIREDILRSVLDMYLSWMQTVPEEFAMDPALVRAMFEPSMATVGAPTFWFANMGDAGSFAMLGGVRVPDAENLLQQMIALSTGETYQKQMAASGMKVSDPVARVVNDQTVYRWSVELDEEAFLKQLREAGAPDADQADLAPLKQVLDMFLSGYDYAATSEGLAFGIGAEAGIAQAMQLLGGGKSTSRTLLERIGAPVAPYMVARFDLIAWMQVLEQFEAAPVPVVAGPGEGVLFAGWRVGAAVEQMMLIPAADIRALKAAAQAAQ